MAEIDKKAPTTWGAATRMLQKGSANVTDEDLFGDDPLKPAKKADPLDYLGHFASDTVAEEGHNTPNIKRVGAGAHAKQGYRVIPGNANIGYIDKKTRQQIETAASALGPFRYGGPIATGSHGPEPGSDPSMPLRNRDRAAKAAAPKARGIATKTLRSKRD